MGRTERWEPPSADRDQRSGQKGLPTYLERPRKEHIDLACEILADEFGTGGPNTAYAKFFIGDSFLNPLADPTGDLFAANVAFEPGCSNTRHIHHASMGGGQLLFCTAHGILAEAYSPIAHGEVLKHMDPIADSGQFSIFPVFSGKPLA